MRTAEEYKGFHIENDGTFSMKTIAFIGRGSVPLDLRGSYTKTDLAKQDIDSFLEKKGKDNAKTSTCVGD